MPLVTYEHEGPVSAITMDDGKVNALSPAMQAELNAALDRAAADNATVVLSGRDGVFSAGFDLGVLRGGGDDAAGMVKGGFELARRMLSFPTPVVVACTGHAIAMGLFLLLSGDYRVGVNGPYKLVANEVAIGMSLPRSALEILRQRLTPAHFQRAAMLAETFAPANAVDAGILDRVVEPLEVKITAHELAVNLSSLDASSHLATKLRARQHMLDVIDNDFSVDPAR